MYKFRLESENPELAKAVGWRLEGDTFYAFDDRLGLNERLLNDMLYLCGLTSEDFLLFAWRFKDHYEPGEEMNCVIELNPAPQRENLKCSISLTGKNERVIAAQPLGHYRPFDESVKLFRQANNLAWFGKEDNVGHYRDDIEYINIKEFIRAEPDQAIIDKKVEQTKKTEKELIQNPEHYNKGIEVIKYIDSWNLGFCLGNVVKYVTRCEHKNEANEDLGKALWYLAHELEKRGGGLIITKFCKKWLQDGTTMSKKDA